MRQIILTPDQARVVLQAGDTLEVLDPEGRTVAQLTPLSQADIEAVERAKKARASGEPRVASKDVQRHLERLSEVRQAQVLDEKRAIELLHKLRAGESE